MSYRLIKSQLGGDEYTVLLIIAAIVFFAFVLIGCYCLKKKKSKKNTEKFTYSSSSVISMPESIFSDRLNKKTRPAVDLRAPGVPYLKFPKHLNPP